MNPFIKKSLLHIFIHLLSGLYIWAGGQEPLQDTLQLDPSIHRGQLANGFTYYIKHVPQSKKVLMDLYVKVGLNHQDTGELEFAHIIEHLGFRTARHFKEQLRRKLKQLNIKDSGNTGDLETAYRLNIGSNDMDTLDIGLQWFEDIADLQLTKEAIDIERSAVMQELFFTVGYKLEEYFLESKLFSTIYPCKEDFSDYFRQLKNLSSKSLKEFYKKWYRPERMGLIIAGNIQDMETLEKHIKKRFSGLPPPKGPLPVEANCSEMYFQSPSHFVSLEHKRKIQETGDTLGRINLFIRDKTQNLKNNVLGEFKSHLIWEALISMVQQRATEEHIWGASILPPKPTFPVFQISIFGNENIGQQELAKITGLILQAKIHGFTQEEWRKTQDGILKKLGDTSDPAYWKEQMYRHFIYGEALPEHKTNYMSQWYSGLSLETINSYAGKYLTVMPDDIGIIATTGHQALSYTEDDVRGWIKNLRESSIDPYSSIEETLLKPLVSLNEIAQLKEVAVISSEVNPLGVEEIVLLNGVKVLLHTNHKDEPFKSQIQIHGFSPKGALWFSETDYFSAINAPALIQSTGIGQMNGKELQSFTSNNHIYVDPYIDPLESGIRIKGDLNQLEKLLQLMYLYFSGSKTPNDKTFDIWLAMEHKNYMQPFINPRSLDFKIAMAEVLNDKSVILLEGALKRYKGIKLTDKDKAYEVYHLIFGDASNFTFIFSGNFSRNEILPLVRKYLGNLPNNTSGYEIKYKKEDTILPQRPLYREFLTEEMGISYHMEGTVHYMLRFVSKVPDPMDWKEHIKIKFLGRLISDKLNSFRYEKGGTLYNYSAHGLYNRYLEAYSVGIYLDCTEDELEWLREESKKMVDDIKECGFTPQDFDRIHKNILARWYTTNPESLNARKVYEYIRNNEQKVDKIEREEFVRALTKEDIQQTAKKYLTELAMIEFVMKDSL